VREKEFARGTTRSALGGPIGSAHHNELHQSEHYAEGERSIALPTGRRTAERHGSLAGRGRRCDGGFHLDILGNLALRTYRGNGGTGLRAVLLTQGWGIGEERSNDLLYK